jgi:hypothetical protein
MKLQGFETTETWNATGLVYGRNWGFNYGTYPSISFQNNSYEGLIDEANKALANETIDSGMGFESILGALLKITCTTSIEIEDYEFKHTSFDTEFIGDLTEEQIEFLEEYWYER